MLRLLAGLALTLLLATQASAAAPSTHAVEADIRRLAAIGGGTIGVAAWRIDGKGPRILVNAGERFPMASTFKIAVAGAILAGVDSGRLRLGRMIPVDPAMHVPSEVIADRFVHPGVSLSIYNLIEVMLTQSDNTATDVLIQVAGGAPAVTAWVRKQQVPGLSVDRDTAELLRDFFRLPAGPLQQAFEQAVKQDPALEKQGGLPNPAFDNDVRDTSTPEAMAQLLTRIFDGKALSSESTRVLVGIMERCRTGDARLRGRLPPGTVVANKTGTIGGSVNDAGVITLPDGRGQIAIVVFIKTSELSFVQRERAIAEVARSVYDYFLFASG